MKKNKLKYKQNYPLIGTWSSLSSTNAIDVLGKTKLDFIIIDLEHGMTSFENLENMVRICELNNKYPIIRTMNDDQQEILKCLETGCNSIMVPHISNADNAKKISEFCKYFPTGRRGLSPYTRVHDYSHENIKTKILNINKNNFLGILVEGPEGIENLESISKVKGIDLIYLGLFDISVSVGLPGELKNRKVLQKVKECQNIITSHGKIPGCMSVDIKYSKMLLKYGYQFIAYLNDAYALKSFFDNEIYRLK